MDEHAQKFLKPKRCQGCHGLSDAGNPDAAGLNRSQSFGWIIKGCLPRTETKSKTPMEKKKMDVIFTFIPRGLTPSEGGNPGWVGISASQSPISPVSAKHLWENIALMMPGLATSLMMSGENLFRVATSSPTGLTCLVFIATHDLWQPCRGNEASQRRLFSRHWPSWWALIEPRRSLDQETTCLLMNPSITALESFFFFFFFLLSEIQANSIQQLFLSPSFPLGNFVINKLKRFQRRGKKIV